MYTGSVGIDVAVNSPSCHVIYIQMYLESSNDNNKL